MKDLLSFLLSMTLVFTLAACSDGTISSDESNSSELPSTSSETSAQSSAESSENPVESQEINGSETPVESEKPVEGGNTLIAYFSWSGNTEQMAQMI